MPYETFEDAENAQNSLPENQAAVMKDYIYDKSNEYQEQVDDIEEFIQIKNKIEALNTEIDKLIPFQNQKDIAHRLIAKHQQLQYLMDLLEEYKTKGGMFEKEDIPAMETQLQVLDEKLVQLGGLKSVSIERPKDNSKN